MAISVTNPKFAEFRRRFMLIPPKPCDANAFGASCCVSVKTGPRRRASGGFYAENQAITTAVRHLAAKNGGLPSEVGT